MFERQISSSRENIESYAKQTIHFHVVTESGTELLRSGTQFGFFKIGSIFPLGGKNWVVIDIWNPLSSSDNRWTLVVRPEVSDSAEREPLG